MPVDKSGDTVVVSSETVTSEGCDLLPGERETQSASPIPRQTKVCTK